MQNQCKNGDIFVYKVYRTLVIETIYKMSTNVIQIVYSFYVFSIWFLFIFNALSDLRSPILPPRKQMRPEHSSHHSCRHSCEPWCGNMSICRLTFYRMQKCRNVSLEHYRPNQATGRRVVKHRCSLVKRGLPT